MDKIVKVPVNEIRSIVESVVRESLDNGLNENKYIKKKPNGKWGIIKKSTGDFLDMDYDSKESAESGFRGMMASKYGG